MAKIWLDAGHGGKDPGALGHGLKEKEVNLAVTLKIGGILAAQGHEVLYTRTTDKFVPIKAAEGTTRMTLANRAKADIFVSIHCNAFKNPQAHGLETFSYPGSIKGLKLSTEINDAMVKDKLYHRIRGVKTEKFAVLKYTNMPAALVELAFITNEKDAELLRTKQDEFAAAIARGINNYLDEKADPKPAVLSKFEHVDGKPHQLRIEQAGGKTMAEITRKNCTNGVIFETALPADPRRTYAIAIDQGKPIGANAIYNDWRGKIKRGTMLMYEDGQVTIEYLNHINEAKKPVKWAIGGLALYPSYDMKYEQATADLTGYAYHTAVLYLQGGIIRLVFSKSKCTLDDFRKDIIAEYGKVLVSALNVDGGASSGGRKEGKLLRNTRRLNNIIYFEEEK